MFKHLQTKIMLLLAMILGGANAWAQDVVITLDNIGAELTSTANTEAATTDITATGTEDSYTLNYYQCKKQGSAMLMTKSAGAYISNHTAMPGNIKSVEVFINSGAAAKTTYDCAFSATELNEATQGIGAVNITGGNSHVFSNLNNNGAINVQGAYFCISLGNANNGQVLKLIITCEQGTTANLTSLTLSGTPTKTQYFEGQNFDPTGLTVTANYDDNTTSDVTSRVEWTPSPLTIGTTSVTGSYQNKTVTVNGLTVTEAPGDSQDNPYTVAQAIEATPSTGNVYIHGIVSSFYANDIVSDGSNYRYYISDDGTTTNQLLVYKGKGLNNQTFASAGDLKIGDKVTIYGQLTTYQNAPEINSGNYIVSLVRKQVSSIALSGPYPTTFVEGSEFSHEGIVVTATYDDNSTEDVTGRATFSEPDMTQVGTQTVTVTYLEKTATYTITITEKPKHTATFSVEGLTTTQDFKEGAAIVFPTVTDRNGFTFVGWVTSTINGTQSTAPEMVTNATMGTADVTYYAVFAEGTTITGWQKLTASEVSEAGVYAIISEDGHAFNGTMSNGHGQSTTNAFEFTNGVAESAPEGTCEMTLTVSGDGFTMYNADHGYLYATKAGSGGLAWHNSETSSWSYDAEAENWVYALNGAYLRVYNNTFRTYDRNNNADLYFAHQTEIGSFENYCTTIPTTTITLIAACHDADGKVYGTYSNTSAFVVPSNLIVSEIYIEDGKLNVSNYNEGDIVPANTGVMVAADAGGDYTVGLSSQAGESVLKKYNKLNNLRATGAGITADDMVAEDPACKYYRLTMHNGTQIGFWWGADNGGAFAVDANKAYLAVPAVTGSKIQGFTFGNDGDATEIVLNALKGEQNGEMYNLQGQKVGSEYKGIVIKNNKKYMVK